METSKNKTSSTVTEPGTRTIILSSLKKVALPGVILWIGAALLLISYMFIPALVDALDHIAKIKEKGTYLFSFLSTLFFGGLIPGIYLWRSGAWENRNKFIQLLVLSVFWGLRGMEVDLLYRMQIVWFSDSSSIQTVLSKMAVDQFLYSTTLATLECTLVYALMDNRFSFKKAFGTFNKKYWTRVYPAIVFSNWMVWIPSVCVVYAMPAALQIPIFDIVLCFWSLLLNVLTSHNKNKQ